MKSKTIMEVDEHIIRKIYDNLFDENKLSLTTEFITYNDFKLKLIECDIITK